jgi:hypothetical protein
MPLSCQDGDRAGWHPYINTQRRTRNLTRQLEALGHAVTLTPAGAAIPHPALADDRYRIIACSSCRISGPNCTQ